VSTRWSVNCAKSLEFFRDYGSFGCVAFDSLFALKSGEKFNCEYVHLLRVAVSKIYAQVKQKVNP
jgi:hypothetical protein